MHMTWIFYNLWDEHKRNTLPNAHMIILVKHLKMQFTIYIEQKKDEMQCTHTHTKYFCHTKPCSKWINANGKIS